MSYASAGSAAAGLQLLPDARMVWWPLQYNLNFMAMMGMIEEVYRLPMCSTTDENKAVLRASLVNVGVL